MRLDIGCGTNPMEGFTGVDRYVVMDGIVNADMWDLPYPDDSIDEIYSSHALEHVEKGMIESTLREWRRVLKPGAAALILVPDLEWCCRNWLEHKTNDWWMDTIFGNQTHAGEFHKTGFTNEIMFKYLGNAGFKEAKYGEKTDHEQNTLWFVVRKDGLLTA